jgi:hypothetical protein
MPIPIDTAYGPVAAVAEWLRANDIDPDDVPFNASISIERLTYGGDWWIRCTCLLRNAEGHRYADPSTLDVAQEERIVPLKVEPPANVQVRGLQA